MNYVVFLVFILFIIIGGMVYLSVLLEYRIASPRIIRQLGAWGAQYGVQLQEQKGEEGRIFSFVADRAGSSFYCEYAASYERKLAPPKLSISVPCQVPAELELFKEKIISRLSKKIGLDREIQTREDYFDAEYYIQTDATEFYQDLLSRREVRCFVSELLGTSTARRLLFKDGSIRLVFSPVSPWMLGSLKIDRIVDCLASLAAFVARQADGKMEVISGSCQAKSSAIEKKQNIPKFLFALITAGLGVWMYFYGHARVYSIGDGFIGAMLMIAGGLTAFMAMIGYFAFRGTSRSRKLLLGLLATQFSANLILAWGATLYVNCQLDRSRSEFLDAMVIGKESRFGKDLRTHYKLNIIMDEGREWESLSVPKNMYNRAKINDRLRLARQAGRLGIPWISDVKPLWLSAPVKNQFRGSI